jgi:hypothetical protein
METDMTLELPGEFRSTRSFDFVEAAQNAADELAASISTFSHLLRDESQSPSLKLMQARLQLLRSVGFENEFAFSSFLSGIKNQSLAIKKDISEGDGFAERPDHRKQYYAFEAKVGFTAEWKDVVYSQLGCSNMRTLRSTWVGWVEPERETEYRVAADDFNPDYFLERARVDGVPCYVVETHEAAFKWWWSIGGRAVIAKDAVAEDPYLSRWLRPYPNVPNWRSEAPDGPVY